MSSLSQLGENAILQELLQQLPSHPELILGPGDDCAVIAGTEQWDYLIKTDVIVENIHFLPDSSPALIGRKALARNISDIAAMGGIPTHALITLLVHPSRSMESLRELYHEGICPLARQYGISIAGGETSSLPQDGLIINISLVGKIERGEAVTRTGAQAGDIIAVSGRLGGSFPSERHLSFEPRLDLARFLLCKGYRPTSMMDLSDGLATDLPRLCLASGCGYDIQLDQLPCHEGCSPEAALRDGEDYELLLTFSPSTWETLATETALPTPLHAIGHITREGYSPTPQGKDWQHFNNL